MDTFKTDNNTELFLSFGLVSWIRILMPRYFGSNSLQPKMRTAEDTDQHEREPTNSVPPEILARKSEQL